MPYKKPINKDSDSQPRLFGYHYKIMCTKCHTLLILTTNKKEYHCHACKNIMTLDR